MRMVLRPRERRKSTLVINSGLAPFLRRESGNVSLLLRRLRLRP